MQGWVSGPWVRALLRQTLQAASGAIQGTFLQSQRRRGDRDIVHQLKKLACGSGHCWSRGLCVKVGIEVITDLTRHLENGSIARLGRSTSPRTTDGYAATRHDAP